MKRLLSTLVILLCLFPDSCFASSFSEYHQNRPVFPASGLVFSLSYYRNVSSYGSRKSSTESVSDLLYFIGGVIVFSIIISFIDTAAKKTKNENEKAAKEEERRKAKTEREIRQWQREQESIVKRQQAERERLERERNMPAQRRFVAEQRRLMSDSLRYEVMRRDGFRCQICGATAKDGYKLHVDHIYPVSKGGKTELSNLRTLCERCNMGKSDKIEKIPLVPRISTYTQDEKEKKPIQPKNSPSDPSYDNAINFFKNNSIAYIDKTANGGGLYFFNEQYAEQLKQKGYSVHFAPNGTKSTDRKPAYYIRFKQKKPGANAGPM